MAERGGMLRVKASNAKSVAAGRFVELRSFMDRSVGWGKDKKSGSSVVN